MARPMPATRPSLALVGALALGGCMSTDPGSPAWDGGPNPAPPPGYVVHCHPTSPPLPPTVRVYSTACEGEIAPARPVVRARG